MTPPPVPKIVPYRRNVGAIILRRPITNEYEVLSLRRDPSRTWQMPQGGYTPDEPEVEALFREIYEETGIKRDRLHYVEKIEQIFTYEWPDAPHYRAEENIWYRGQAQQWHVLIFMGNDYDIDLSVTNDDSPYEDWQWMTFAGLAKQIITYKRDIYAALCEHVKTIDFRAVMTA